MAIPLEDNLAEQLRLAMTTSNLTTLCFREIRDTSTARVVTEKSVGSENTELPIIREIMVATAMSSLFVAFFAWRVSSFRTRVLCRLKSSHLVTKLPSSERTRFAGL
jgi:hypothetical protein